MTPHKLYIEKLFAAHKINITAKQQAEFDNYITEPAVVTLITKINQYQQNIMETWKLKQRILTITDQQIKIPNATINIPYQVKIDFIQLGWNDIVHFEFENAANYGLTFNAETEMLSGTPTQSGDVKINLKFKIAGEAENAPLNTKVISFFINADPKSLWVSIDSNNTDPFWKPDNLQDFKPIGDKHIVVSSKRGRSHANVGSFRDDDYAFKHFNTTGWSVVVVADGAGSAKASRKGSQIACEGIINYFQQHLTAEVSEHFDALMKIYKDEQIAKPEINAVKSAGNITEIIEKTEHIIEEKNLTNAQNTETNVVDAANITANSEQLFDDKGEAIKPDPIILEVVNINREISNFIYNNLGNAARTVHKNLDTFATQNNLQLKDLHTTLIYTLFKKYSFGYVILSFGVGDCPIGVLNTNTHQFKLMNWLDVGEFGGGTRFITMPEIFTSDKFGTRFGFKLIDDFTHLILMTDGIYDPKFVVEASLEKIEKWEAFLDDLAGNNNDSAMVNLNPSNADVANQLNTWMDFWSPGNHDDRTLAIVF